MVVTAQCPINKGIEGINQIAIGIFIIPFDADSVPIIEKSPDDNPTELSVEFGTGLVYTSFTN